MPRVIITVPESNPQPYRFSLDREVVNMGRGSDNDIIIDSGSVSGMHAEMHRVEGGYELRDLGSTNGIKVGESRQQMIALRSGMTVYLGDVGYEFILTDEEQEVLKKERPYEDLPPIKAEEEVRGKDEEVGEKEAGEQKVKPEPRRKPEVAVKSGGAGFGSVLLFLILIGAAFVVGLAVRHEKDTGESLLKAVVNKGEPDSKEAPAE